MLGTSAPGSPPVYTNSDLAVEQHQNSPRSQHKLPPSQPEVQWPTSSPREETSPQFQHERVYPVYRGPNGQQVNPGKRGALRRIVLDDNVDLSVLTAVQEQQGETRLRILTLRSFQSLSRTNPKQKVTLVCLKR